MANRLALLAGGLLCLTGVGIGAFGAHGLSDLLAQNARADTFELANRYQFYHGLGLLMLGCIAFQHNLKIRAAVILMILGTVVFSCSLYLLSITNYGWLGAVTPVGGVLLIVSWSLVIRALLDVSAR